MNSQNRSRLILTRSIGDRILIGGLCAPMAIFFGAICLSLEGASPANSAQRFGQGAAFEVFFAFATFMALGLLWAAFAPRWIESMLESAYRKVVFTITVLALTSVCTALHFTVVK